MRQQVIVGLDVGSSKVGAVAAAVRPGNVDVLGLGLSPATGLRKGVVTDIDETVDSIRRAVREVESSAGVRVRSVSVGISGAHIESFEGRGAVGVRGSEVAYMDIKRAIEAAGAVYIPLDREVLHVIPTGFVLDGHEGISNPVGMSGIRLEAKVHIVTGAVSAIQNLLKCCEKSGLDIADVVFAPLASSRAVLTVEETDSGVVLVDIGGGTTDIALFRGGNLLHASVLGVGGGHITNDIAVGLRVHMSEAERLKRTSGSVDMDRDDAEPEIRITQAGGQVRTLQRECLVNIIQPRCGEMLELVRAELKRGLGYEHASCGVVLTGGSSLLEGFAGMAEEVLALPVRVGVPSVAGGCGAILKNVQFATGAGLVMHCPEFDRTRAVHPVSSNSLFGRMRHWARDFFSTTDTLSIDQEYKKKGESHVRD